ncbi:MAG TPA: DUF6048 family protein [Paludibacter sp.]|nr:DUF6048 family protein [Paludibacter sp.]
MFWLSIYTVNAQNQNNKDSVKIDKINFINGIRIELDVSPVITTLLSKGDTYSFEGAVQTTLFQKYFPVFELGFAGANRTSTENVNFTTNGGFFRVGTDFSVMKPKKIPGKFQNFFLVGARLGFSNFTYNMTNVNVYDEYWDVSKTYDFNDVAATKVWFEIAAGIRVEIINNIYMGWTLRNKRMLTNDAEGKISPWYIPGFGVNATSNWGVNYALGYKF